MVLPFSENQKNCSIQTTKSELSKGKIHVSNFSHILGKPSISIEKPSFSIKKPSILIEKPTVSHKKS